MTDEELMNCPDVRVAMSIKELRVSISDLLQMRADPRTSCFVADGLGDLYAALGSLAGLIDDLRHENDPVSRFMQRAS